MIRTLFAIAALLATPTAAQETGDGQYVNINGMKMYYEVTGSGEPIVVLHGAYMNIPTMGEIIPRLAETRTVYALEFQGHGRTNDIERPVTYPNLSDDVAKFMDAVGLEKADVLGYSMGAAAGLRLAIDHPEKVDQLVAISVAYSMEGMQPEYLAFVPNMTPEMFVGSPMEDAWMGKAVERIQNSKLKSMVVTDSIAVTAAQAACANIRTISIAPLLGEAMRRINNEASVSSLFD